MSRIVAFIHIALENSLRPVSLVLRDGRQIHTLHTLCAHEDAVSDHIHKNDVFITLWLLNVIR